MTPHLFIGNRNYSSWSLRAWLPLCWSGMAFSHTLVDLDQPGYGEGRIAGVLSVSPSGKVPVLTVGGETIWDSLAIGEWVGEQHPALVPADPMARALMRSVVAEMHSGFTDLRAALPMNLARRCVARGYSDAVARDIARIDALWSMLIARFSPQGPHLFGARSLADAAFLPVATRFRTYAINLSPTAARYRDHILKDEAFLAWEALAAGEAKRGFSRAPIDNLYAAEA